MALKINVTWPRHLPQICIPFDCSDLESISRKATKSGDDIVIDGAFGQGNRVCDDDRYRIDRRSNDPLECCERDAAFEQTLVIVLESPHKAEYLGNRIDRPIAPAVGRTGHNIRNHLMDVIRSCSHIHCRLVQETRVILANPIPFQTSLASTIRVRRQSGESKSGESKSEKRKREERERKKRENRIRDAVWKALWYRQAIRNGFKERLKGYGPKLIINACTHDEGCEDKKCLNDLLEQPASEPIRPRWCKKRTIYNFLARNFPDAHIYATSHPASPNWKKKEKKKGFLKLV